MASGFWGVKNPQFTPLCVFLAQQEFECCEIAFTPSQKRIKKDHQSLKQHVENRSGFIGQKIKKTRIIYQGKQAAEVEVWPKKSNNEGERV